MVSTDRVAECEYEIFFFGIHDKNADITWSLIIWDYLITLDDEVRPYCILLPYISSVLTVFGSLQFTNETGGLVQIFNPVAPARNTSEGIASATKSIG